MERLGRWAWPLSVVAALLLIVGITLTGLNLLLAGWSVYAVGHVGAMAAFAAVAAANRQRLDGWGWLGLLVLEVGLLLGLPLIAAIWQTYAQAGGWLPVAGREMELPVWTPPFGLTAELVTWVGVAFSGLAARGAHALPSGVGWLMVGAAAVGVIAAFYVVSPYAWVAAVLLLALALLAMGTALRQPQMRLAR